MELNFDIDFTEFLEDDSTGLEFNLGDFNLVDDEEKNPRMMKPSFSKKPIRIDYKNAKDLVMETKLGIGEQLHTIVQGNFIFGDYIEALLVERNLYVEHLYLSTLSLSQNNVDSLQMLLEEGYIGKLTIMVSNYFYSHEKNKLIKYMVDKLDQNNKLSILVCRNHTKICLMDISNLRIVLTGSSNLRSSQSIEQFVLQESQELYTFYKDFFMCYIDKDIINKEVQYERKDRVKQPKDNKQSRDKKS